MSPPQHRPWGESPILTPTAVKVGMAQSNQTDKNGLNQCQEPMDLVTVTRRSATRKLTHKLRENGKLDVWTSPKFLHLLQKNPPHLKDEENG